PQEQRRRLVESLEVVDKAVLGYDTLDHTVIVTDVNPDVIALGYDQKTDIESLEKQFQEKNMTTRIVRMEQRKADGLYSSTLIRERIIEFYRENGRART
ncbi:MAG: adenylyltransferase/cytidyltransferase family protein, partial [Candidatus Thorarchaeota archaeon]